MIEEAKEKLMNPKIDSNILAALILRLNISGKKISKFFI